MTNYLEVARLYSVWKNMFSRCYNSKNKQFSDYGERGIFIEDTWHDFNTFCQWCLDNGSSSNLQLDRIDNDGPYADWNCRFVTAKENARNKRDNHLVTCWGETKTLSAWSEDTRVIVKAETFRRRIKAGWDVEEALTLAHASLRQSGSYKCGHPRTKENSYKRGKTGYNMCKTCAKNRAKENYMSLRCQTWTDTELQERLTEAHNKLKWFKNEEGSESHIAHLLHVTILEKELIRRTNKGE